MPLTFTFVPPRVNGVAVLHAAKEFAEHEAAEKLLEMAKELVPEDSGALKGSGIVVPTTTGAAVVFSATNEDDKYDYAARQHEDETLHHPNGGQAHYLSQPMETEQAAILGALAAALRARL